MTSYGACVISEHKMHDNLTGINICKKQLSRRTEKLTALLANITCAQYYDDTLDPCRADTALRNSINSSSTIHRKPRIHEPDPDCFTVIDHIGIDYDVSAIDDRYIFCTLSINVTQMKVTC